MKMPTIKKALLVPIVASLLAMTTAPSEASSDSGSYSWPNGVRLSANVWGETVCSNDCDWKTSSKVTKSGSAFRIGQVRNCATLKEHGLAGSVSVKWFEFGVTTDRDSATKCWTNGVGEGTAWIADLAGSANPAWNTWYISVDSNATGWYYAYGSARSASAGI